ncbi:MAG: radical SAM protein [Sedimentisphaerales bacterium]|nr:radical SAM protein [Sedimentisphaerales bacterium]
MTAIITHPDTHQKLEILSSDAQYDLACACSTKDPAEHRKRSEDGRWIYPVTLPNGGSSVLFKTLVSNVCNNDCKYCPLREGQDTRRCSLSVKETVQVFLDYYRRKKVFGLFLSSGMCGGPDTTMERLIGIARQLRQKEQFRGYIHLKIIPGASDTAIEEAVRLSTAVSLNIETPGAKNLAKLSDRKNYIRDIIEPIKLISRLTGKGNRYSRVKQTTQFIVGAAGESDAEIVQYMGGLYDRLGLQRIYFSAYQHGLGTEDVPGEDTESQNPFDLLTREHRLYQVDFLLRRYGFKNSEMIFDSRGRLSLEIDPKEAWAWAHPERFPISVNTASRYDLLRVPGLGPVTVNRILQRRQINRLRRIEDVGRPGKLLQKAAGYLRF